MALALFPEGWLIYLDLSVFSLKNPSLPPWSVLLLAVKRTVLKQKKRSDKRSCLEIPLVVPEAVMPSLLVCSH